MNTKKKGRNNFTKAEIVRLAQLFKAKDEADTYEETKGIRAKMRRMGFYITDFASDMNFTDFQILVKNKKIIISDYNYDNETESHEVKEHVSHKKSENKETKNVANEVESIHSFKPLIDKDSQILILGTMPGPESLQTGEYYTSKRNSFWKIMARLFNDNKTFDNYEDKVACLHRNHIALWDVFEFCKRDGASDSSIRNEKRNDIESLLNEYPSIKKIILNGNKAAEGFNASVPFERVCSSSSYKTLEEKVDFWGKAIKG